MMRLHLIDRLIERANRSPSDPVLRQIETGRTCSWAELDRGSTAVAQFLRRHLPVGSVVMLVGPNEPEFVAAFCGILRSGCKAFPMSPSSSSRELRFAAELSNAKSIIGSDETAGALSMDIPTLALNEIGALFLDGNAEDSDRDLSQAALLLTSSGTTGKSKIVHRSAAAVNAMIEGIVGAIGMQSSDHVLAAVPLCHSYGVEHGLLAPLSAGSRVNLAQGLDLPTILQELRDGTTIFPGVPSMFEMLAQGPHEPRGSFASLRKVYSAGAPLPQFIAEKFASQFSDPADEDFNPLSVGKPTRGSVLAIIDPDASGVGEVAIRATSMFDGYLGEPASNGAIENGFFRTGDLGKLDDRGNLLITGRIKLLIDVGGKKVNPQEVEQVLAEHPAVKECVVLPVQLSATVTRLRALVQPRRGERLPSVDDLRRHLRDRLSPYKVPRVIEFRDSFPRSATGKILRQKLQG
jgi:acyl-CoA synthetase (AMP-forming)/AMP-acid ligase II